MRFRARCLTLRGQQEARRERERELEGEAERGGDEAERDGGDEEEEEEEGLGDFIEYEPGQERAAKRAAGGGAGSVTSRALKEANAIFGDFADFMPAAARRRERDEKESGLADVEPALLAERFHTAQDERLRSTTLPERYELAVIEAGRAPPDDGELRDEAAWIWDRAFAPLAAAGAEAAAARAVGVERIAAVLEFMRRDNLEVPFIARYRQDYWADALQAVHLWDVAEWDERWTHLHQRKRQVEAMFKATQEGTLHPEEALSMLRSVASEEELTDMHDYYNLHVSSSAAAAPAPAGAAAPGTATAKRPVKRDLYSVCRRAGLLNCAKYFGLSAQQLGENLFANVMTSEVKDHSESPAELAERFTCPGFLEADAVLRACRHIQAKEIAFEPRVRQWLRPRYAQAALLSTVATPRGKKELDAWHPHRAVKRLLNKPIAALRNSTQFLQILQAESLGLISKRLHVSETEDELFAREMERLYLSDQFGKHSAAWNEQRRQIVREALTAHLYPLLERELVQTLTTDAKRLVAQQCGRRLEELLMQGPYRGANAPADARESVPVVACVWGGAQASWFVAVDRDGALLDSLKLPFLGVRADAERGSRADFERKLDDLARVRAFVSQHEPHALLLCAAPGAEGGVESRRLWDELTNVANELRDASVALRHLQLLWVDGEPARIFKNSPAAAAEFPDEPPVVRQAVALARYVQDPLTLLAALCNADADVLGLKLHPLQELLSREERLRHLERRFVKVVNAVGVDLVRVARHRHAAATLQFVAGLGPRKAASLLGQLAKARVRSREKLEELLSPTVYTNAAGFLYVPPPAAGDDDDAHEPLDGTRVHPADYPFARKMAADALDSADVDDAGLVQEIMRAPERLEALAADALEVAAGEWERRMKEKKLRVLYDIKEELSAPFRDPRPAFRPVSDDALFALLTGETPDSLRVGQLLTVQVQAIRGDRVVCVLDSGVTGVIAKANVSDGVFNRIDEKVAVGMVLPARLLAVDKTAFTAELTARGSELAARDRWEQAHLAALWERERYLMPDSPERDERREEAKAKAPPVLMRNVTHPYFKNVSARDAEALLKEKADGEFLIRPATTSAEHLTLCWKWNGSVVHFDVQELDKPKRFELGKKLRLGHETFDDLNELIARYVEPMSQLARDVADFRYYRRGSVEEVERELREAKAAQATRIPYLVSPSQHAGRYVLSYLPGARAKHELFTLTPRGLRFRGQVFPGTEQLIKHLKVSFGRAARPAQR